MDNLTIEMKTDGKVYGQLKEMLNTKMYITTTGKEILSIHEQIKSLMDKKGVNKGALLITNGDEVVISFSFVIPKEEVNEVSEIVIGIQKYTLVPVTRYGKELQFTGLQFKVRG